MLLSSLKLLAFRMIDIWNLHHCIAGPYCPVPCDNNESFRVAACFLSWSSFQSCSTYPTENCTSIWDDALRQPCATLSTHYTGQMTIRTKETTSGQNNVYHSKSPCAYWLTVSIQRKNDLNREEVICDIQLSTRGVSQRESKQL